MNIFDKTQIQKEILNFANAITPKNWNIVTNNKNFSTSPGVLNIQLMLVTEDEWHPYMTEEGTKVYPIESKNGEELYEDRHGNTYTAQELKIKTGQTGDMNFIKEKGEKKAVADTDITLWLDKEKFDDAFWKSTLVHELAHVLVFRHIGFKVKSIYQDVSKISPIILHFQYPDYEEDAHGPLFQKAIKLMHKITIKIMGKKIPKHDSYWMSACNEICGDDDIECFNKLLEGFKDPNQDPYVIIKDHLKSLPKEKKYF